MLNPEDTTDDNDNDNDDTEFDDNNNGPTELPTDEFGYLVSLLTKYLLDKLKGA